MIKGLGLFVVSLALAVGCSDSTPKDKLEPFDPAKKVDKGLNNVSFSPAIDILFIIDDSGSMSSQQTRLAANAKLFVETFLESSIIDFHIGVTTSTLATSWGGKVSGGALHNVGGYRYVDRKTTDADKVLKDMMDVGTGGSASEEFFSIHMAALSPQNLQGANFGFYRDYAHLAIFVLTDTEDQSGVTPISAFDFLMNLKGGDESKLYYTAAIIEPTSSCRGENMDPVKIRSVVDMFKNRGYRFDLCKNDYGKDMAAVASELVSAIAEFKLDQVPDIRTINVTYGDFVIPNDPDRGWVYDVDTNSIRISPNLGIEDSTPRQLNISFEAAYK